MTSVNTQVDTHTPFDVGPVLQCFLDYGELGLELNVDASSNINSYLIYSNGYKIFTFALTSNQSGTVSIQKYIDTEGTIAQGSPITASFVADNPILLNNSSNLPFQTIKINISNSGVSQATLSNVALIFQSS